MTCFFAVVWGSYSENTVYSKLKRVCEIMGARFLTVGKGNCNMKRDKNRMYPVGMSHWVFDIQMFKKIKNSKVKKKLLNWGKSYRSLLNVEEHSATYIFYLKSYSYRLSSAFLLVWLERLKIPVGPCYVRKYLADSPCDSSD